MAAESPRYTLPFCSRFGIHTHMNTSTFRLSEREHVNPIYAGYGYERGMRLFANVRISPKGPVCDDYEETWKALTEGPWTNGFSISVDENLVDQNQAPWRTVNYSEAAWKMVALRPEQSINLFYAGYDPCTRDAFREWLKAHGAADWAAAEVPSCATRRTPAPAIRLETSRKGDRTVYDARIPLAAIGFGEKTLANGFRFNAIVYDDDGLGESRDCWIEIVPGIAGKKEYSDSPFVKIVP